MSIYIYIQHDEQETFCEDASIQMGYNQPIAAQTLAKLQIKTEPNKSSTADDSVIILTKGLNETIMIEESQPTQELFKHVLDIKNEMSTEMNVVSPNVSNIDLPSPVNKPQSSKIITRCADCDEVILFCFHLELIRYENCIELNDILINYCCCCHCCSTIECWVVIWRKTHQKSTVFVRNITEIFNGKKHLPDFGIQKFKILTKKRHSIHVLLQIIYFRNKYSI